MTEFFEEYVPINDISQYFLHYPAQSEVEEYYNKINAPKKNLFWIEDAGHLTDVDNPDEYNKAIECIYAEL